MVGFECFGELDDVGVLELLHQHDFATDAVSPVLVHKLRLVVDLGRVVLPFAFLVREADDGIGALAEQPAELIVLIDFVRCAVSGWRRGRGEIFGLTRLSDLS